MGMGKNNNEETYTVNINNGVGVLDAATAGALGADTNGQTILTAGANGSRVESLIINSTEAVIQNYLVYIKNGSDIYPIGIVSIPANSGNSSSTPAIDVLSSAGTTLQGLPIDSNGKRYISMKPSDILKFSSLANMTTAKKTWATAMGGDY